jgi:hypothetical protein
LIVPIVLVGSIPGHGLDMNVDLNTTLISTLSRARQGQSLNPGNVRMTSQESFSSFHPHSAQSLHNNSSPSSNFPSHRAVSDVSLGRRDRMGYHSASSSSSYMKNEGSEHAFGLKQEVRIHYRALVLRFKHRRTDLDSQNFEKLMRTGASTPSTSNPSNEEHSEYSSAVSGNPQSVYLATNASHLPNHSDPSGLYAQQFAQQPTYHYPDETTISNATNHQNFNAGSHSNSSTFSNNPYAATSTSLSGYDHHTRIRRDEYSTKR